MLRRRRRQATQVIRKKNLSSTTYPNFNAGKSPRESRSRKGFLIWFLVIVVLAAVSYYLYQGTALDRNGAEDQAALSEGAASGPATVEESPAAEQEPAAPFQNRIQIEILNACGVNGIAKMFESYLRDQGFDVVNTENYKEAGKVRWDLPESRVIDNTGDEEKALAVARALGIPESNVHSEYNASAIFDVTVVVGLDYQGLTGMENQENI